MENIKLKLIMCTVHILVKRVNEIMYGVNRNIILTLKQTSIQNQNKMFQMYGNKYYHHIVQLQIKTCLKRSLCISSMFARKYEANASKYHGNLEEMSLCYW